MKDSVESDRLNENTISVKGDVDGDEDGKQMLRRKRNLMYIKTISTKMMRR